MPYASDAQRRFFHTATARKKGIDAATVAEFDAASKGQKLPARVKHAAAFAEGVKLAVATFAAPPRPAAGASGPVGKPPGVPERPATPKPPTSPAQHATNDVNTSMSATGRKLGDVTL